MTTNLAKFLDNFETAAATEMLSSVFANDRGDVLEAGIIGDQRAMFYATIAHETGGFTRFAENLSYSSAERIFAVFGPRYFPGGIPEATRFIKRPEALANRVYGGRMGNGPEASGDGWRYRGRGLIQLTGRDNYRRAGLEQAPDLASDPKVALGFAASWWVRHIKPKHINSGFETVTRVVNGGLNGWAHRVQMLELARNCGLGLDRPS